MKRLLFLLISAVILFGQLPAAGQKPITMRDLKGFWSGHLKIQSMQLKLDMNISYNEADSLIVTFDSPDQGVLDLPTSKVTLTDSLYISLHGIGASFAGLVSPRADTIRSLWKQAGMSFPITMVRQGQKTTLNRPQEPLPPFPYRTEEVVFKDSTAGCELAGTLTLPEKPGRFPLAVLVTGSGPQDRNEELLGHKPFLVLADFLTRSGFAVLRYDDRGTGKSTGDFGKATTLDFAADASAALDFARRHREVDTSRMGIIGHSEGGLIAPMVASSRKDVAFLVLLAGPGVPGEQILLAQAELIGKAEGNDAKSLEASQNVSKEIYTVLRKNSDNEKAAAKIRDLMKSFDKKMAGDTSYHPLPEAALNAQIKSITSPWFRCFLTLDPQQYLTKVTCPLLAVNGSLDLQVPAKENLQAIEKALIFGGNSRYTVEELQGLNHLFQTATTGSPTEYGKIEETMSPVALELIGTWLTKNVMQ